MRLFTAINLDEEAKNRLMEPIRLLRQQTLKGTFTQRENLHLTLVFIGETVRCADAAYAVRSVAVEPFEIILEGIGKFPRDGGDIWWIGVRPSEKLAGLQRRVAESLETAGFPVERREFRPHLTLGRRVVPGPGFDRGRLAESVPALSVPVSRVVLMQSERIGGRMVYTEYH